MTTEVVTAKSEIIRLEKEEIEKIIPHREPMLLVDRVVSLMPGEFIVAEKTVTEEECRGHFPGNPIFPGVLTVESLAQACAILGLYDSLDAGDTGQVLFRGIEKAKFRKIAKPGDCLILRGQILKSRRGLQSFAVEARSQEGIVVQGEISATVV